MSRTLRCYADEDQLTMFFEIIQRKGAKRFGKRLRPAIGRQLQGAVRGDRTGAGGEGDVVRKLTLPHDPCAPF